MGCAPSVAWREDWRSIMWEWASGWIAPAATIIAAMMTAANAGARVTGWGFVVFTIGSIAWSVLASLSGQGNLLVTNLFLTFVNAVGVWRWLGREATYEIGSLRAVRRSSRTHAAPTLFSASHAVGAEVTDANGEKLGVVVDLMLRRDQRSLCYVVIAHHGLGGVGETASGRRSGRLGLCGRRRANQYVGCALGRSAGAAGGQLALSISLAGKGFARRSPPGIERPALGRPYKASRRRRD